MIISKYNHKDIEEFNTLLYQIQKIQNKPVQKKYKSTLLELYSLMAESFTTYGVFENDLKATISFLRLDNSKNIFFITDLLKHPELTSLVSLKFVLFFLETQRLWEQPFCLTFVEEDLNALESLLNSATRKYGLLKREELIYCNIFFVNENKNVSSSEQNGSPQKKKIENNECIFFTDKHVRTFFIGEKNYSRAYVKIPSNLPEEFFPLVIDAGKQYASETGCNIFVLLTSSQLNFQQDYVYTNRKIELWNREVGERIDLVSKGILI